MEILAPAGSFEALQAAVHYGADAVYVGGSRYSARKSAQNFTDEELADAVRFCHVRGVRLYLCCNTLLKESELSAAMAFIRYAYTIGVDALIIQDLGLIRRVRQELPEMPVHASTQMTVVNSAGVETLASLGVKRVVLAREVTAAEIREIRKHTDTELEYFVHGALCISYSGQCLMSSILGGRSGNRGGCAQPCRLPYTLLQDGRPVTEAQPLLCPKDLCLAGRIQELKKLGVASLKIEGRLKSPAYVAMTTQVYKQASEGNVSEQDIRSMLKFFSRGGSCQGYFDGCTFGDMMDKATGSKIAESLPVLEKKEKTIPVKLRLTAQIGQALRLVMEDENGMCAAAEGGSCEKAHTSPTTAERMKEQLAKLGGTPFHAEEITIEASPDAAIAVKALNALRRSCAEKLESCIAQKFERPPIQEQSFEPAAVYRAAQEPELCAEVRTQEQLQAACDMGIRRIYMPETLFLQEHKAEEPVLLLPPLTKEGQSLSVGGAAEVCIQNLGQLSAAGGLFITGGHRLNITNSRCVEQLSALGVTRFVLSPELNIKGISALRRKTGAFLEVIGYGRLPLMLLENCIIRSTLGSCQCREHTFSLLDRKNEAFPVLPGYCGNVIYNSKPIYMADRLTDIKNLQINGIRLSFTLENYETCCIIIREYQAALAGKSCKAPEGGFTRGHFYRGMQ